MFRLCIAGACLLGLVGCVAAPTDGAADARPVTESDGGVDPIDEVEPEAACRRLLGTSVHAVTRADVALSSAYALARYFGAFSSRANVDAALVTALRESGGEISVSLRRFAAALDGVCARSSAPSATAKVTRRGELAFVIPGAGAIDIPNDARGIVIDLRDVSGGADTERALVALAAKLGLSGELRARVHVRTGLTDEAFSTESLYTDAIEERTVVNLSRGDSKEDRPVAVLVGRRISPEAARFALALRAARAVRIAGESVPVDVAEMRWATGADADVAVRTMDLVLDEQRLPDEVPADVGGDDEALDGLLVDLTAPAAMSTEGRAKRAKTQRQTAFGDVEDGEPDPAVASAALLSAHGAAKLFFPYFHVIEDRTDERLAETLAAATTVRARSDVRNLLRRFGNVLQDGHNWTIDAVSEPAWPIPIVLDRLGSDAVVRRSYASGIAAGDRIVGIGGEDAGTWYGRELARTYGATDGFRSWTALQELVNGSVRDLVVARPDGTKHSVSVPNTNVAGDLYAGSTRAAGWLGDVGAPDVYYFNADGQHAGSDADVDAAFSAAASGRGMIIDMRGHPADGTATFNPYAMVSMIATSDVPAPFYRVPVLDGAGGRADVMPYQEKVVALGGFTKPIILITDSMSVSFAEDFAMLLASTGKLRAIVGRPTAGTTGSVTGIQLPGGFQFYMTGMEARWPNGDRLFGRGVVPTILVEPTAEDYAAERDPMLLRAIVELPPG